jgi:hypothetical protein
MYCIPKEVADNPVDFSFCSCEYSGDLFQNHDDGTICQATPGTYGLIAIWIFVAAINLLVLFWLLYVMYCAKAGRVFKADLFSCGLIATSINLICLTLDGIARPVELLSNDPETVRVFHYLGSATDTASRSFAGISFGFTARAMYTLLLNLLHLPLDDAVESSRNRWLTLYILLFVLITVLLREETIFYQPPAGSIVGVGLAVFTWLLFRRGGTKMSDGLASRLLRQSQHMRGEGLIRDIRNFLIRFLNVIFLAFFIISSELVGWYCQRLIGNWKVFSVFATLGKIGVHVGVSFAAWILVLVQTSLAAHQIEVWSQMQAIAILVNHNPGISLGTNVIQTGTTNSPLDEKWSFKEQQMSIKESQTSIEVATIVPSATDSPRVVTVDGVTVCI